MPQGVNRASEFFNMDSLISEVESYLGPSYLHNVANWALRSMAQYQLCFEGD